MLKLRPLRRLWLLSFLTLTGLLLWSTLGITPQALAQAGRADKGGIEPPKQGSQPAIEDVDPDQPLGTSFDIYVTVKNEPEPSGRYTVEGAGFILMHVAEVQTPVAVRGLTPTDAAKKIADFLKNFMKDPDVTVSILTVPQPVAEISGAVKAPGEKPINRRTTLEQLLSRAEYLPEADLTQIRVTHHSYTNGKDKVTTQVVDLNKYIFPQQGKAPDETQNIYVVDKDAIFVPTRINSKAIQNTFSVTGEVAKPSQVIPLRTTPVLTIREAMSLAGGATTMANRNKVTLLRPGQHDPIVVDLDKAETGDTGNNLEIHPDDAIYVERLGPKAFVEVDGGLAKPGRINYDSQTGKTLIQAVMESGGVLPIAKTKEGKILRVSPDGDPKKTQIIDFDWDKVISRKSLDIALQPGDFVSIPAKLPPNGANNPLQYAGQLGYVFAALFGRNGVF
ncbi:MAG TPA: SLBB domain-containing protein [Chthonomonadaceae bacterium]|nr:SLBB domain-containing protein [Chthonomonadaceae bacterium]